MADWNAYRACIVTGRPTALFGAGGQADLSLRQFESEHVRIWLAAASVNCKLDASNPTPADLITSATSATVAWHAEAASTHLAPWTIANRAACFIDAASV